MNTEPRRDEHFARHFVGMAKVHGPLRLEIDLAAGLRQVKTRVFDRYFAIAFAGRWNQVARQDALAWLTRQSLRVDLRLKGVSKAREKPAV